MAHINNFTDMINALPKQEMEVTEDLESPVSPPVSTPTSEPPLIIDRLSTPNGITSISSGEIILPKRSPVADLLKNGPLSAAVCGNSSQRGRYQTRKIVSIGFVVSSRTILYKKLFFD